jgi:hypothetical protein
MSDALARFLSLLRTHDGVAEQATRILLKYRQAALLASSGPVSNDDGLKDNPVTLIGERAVVRPFRSLTDSNQSAVLSLNANYPADSPAPQALRPSNA